MTQQHIETALRGGLTLLAEGGRDQARWTAFERTLRRFIRRNDEADRKDLVQSFAQLLLERRALLTQLLEAPEGALAGRVRQLLRRHVYETQARTETGKLRKAIDDVLRRGDPRLVEHNGQLFTRARAAPAMPSSPFHPCGTRLDHDKLADGAVALLHERGVELGRTRLARALSEAWALESPGAAFHEERCANDEPDAEHRLALVEAVHQVRRTLEPREVTLVVDAARGLPLRTARERVGLSVAAAHGVRRAAGRKLAQVADDFGLSHDDRLFLVEALAG